MDENQDQQGNRIAIGVAIVFLPVLYVLSIGPVVWLVEKLNWPEEYFKNFYQPVVWLHDNTALKAPLEWYGNLFGW